jgi:hypothetical protein
MAVTSDIVRCLEFFQTMFQNTSLFFSVSTQQHQKLTHIHCVLEFIGLDGISTSFGL